MIVQHEREHLPAFVLVHLPGDFPFADLFVQPAAGDAGTSLGAALWIDREQRGGRRGLGQRYAPGQSGTGDGQFVRTARAKGLEVDVLELAPRVMARAVTQEISAYFERKHREAGIRIHFGVRAFEAHGMVNANLLDRDKIFTDENVQILLGTNVREAIDAVAGEAHRRAATL